VPGLIAIIFCKAAGDDEETVKTMAVTKFKSRIVALSALLLAAASTSLAADNWPSRAVTIVVPYAAGGSTDVMGRLLAQRLSEKLGQPFVIENKSGASGNVGATAVARSRADGYTILLATNSQAALNKLLFKDLSYDPVNDFSPIALIADIPQLVVVRSDLGVSSLPELIAYAKKNPGKLSFGSSGVGSQGHLAGALMELTTGIQMLHVPYRGSAPIMTDLLGGRLDVAFDALPTYLPVLGEGKIKALAVTSAERSGQLPDVPTVVENGVPDYEVAPWFSFVAPKDVPSEIVAKVNKIVTEYVRSNEGKAKLVTLGYRPLGGSVSDLSGRIQREVTKWGPIIASKKIALE
jgi:tripartite-type tricarboxylate transporter receptor subunit TctC